MTDHATMAAEQLHYELAVLRGVSDRLLALRGRHDALPARLATACEWIRAARGKIEVTIQAMGEG